MDSEVIKLWQTQMWIESRIIYT